MLTEASAFPPSPQALTGKSLSGFFMLHYVYILQSQINFSFYKGATQDLAKRMTEHNLGQSPFTKKFNLQSSVQARRRNLYSYKLLIISTSSSSVSFSVGLLIFTFLPSP
ncbi:MAG: GIY-YIG nuclease family protein [Bacteroidetes bacterium]|nr:GIY-YIG nuclease family protein [Bacteroidota bacterium]